MHIYIIGLNGIIPLMYIVSVFQLLGKETGPEVELEFDYTFIDLFIYL